MALPFIAGLAVGAGVALLFTKREQIKEKLSSSDFSQNIQKGLSESINKGKEISNNALNYAKDSFKNALNTESKIQESHQDLQNMEFKSPKQRATRKTTKKEN